MTCYLCAQYARKNELKIYREDLLKAGWEVGSTWLDQEDDGVDPAVYARCDILDLDHSDVVIVWPGPPYIGGVQEIARGGRHFESGYAHAKGKIMIVIGAVEGVSGFYYMSNMKHFPDWETFMRLYV